MQTFLHHWYNRPTAVLSWSFAIILWGAWSVTRVPIEWLPQIELPELHINASWPGATPRAIERYVTAPLERAVQDIAGTTSVKSLSQEGRSFITLTTSEDTDPAIFAAMVNERIAMIRSTLPEHVYPYLTKEIPEELRDQQGFMTLQVVGDLSPDALRQLAEDKIAPKIRIIPGIGKVQVSGGTLRELCITLEPAKLAMYKISANSIKQAIHESLNDEVYGRLRMKDHAILLMRPAEQWVQNLANLPILPDASSRTPHKPILISELATLDMQDAPVESISRIDGQNVVTLQLDRTHGSHLIQTADLVRQSLQTQKKDFPAKVRVLVADDKSESVREELRNLAWQGGMGLLLVVLVLLFLLKSIRMASVVLFSVLWAFSISFLLLYPLGITLNLVTLGGLVLVFGMLADNAVVVVVEWARLRKPKEPLEVSVKAVLSVVWMPLLGGTLTTCVVLLPLVYLSDTLQKLFLPMGILIALTLLASLISATLIVPVLGRFLTEDVTRHSSTQKSPMIRKITLFPYTFSGKFPRFTLFVLVFIIGVPMWILPDTLKIATNALPDAPDTRLRVLYNETIGSETIADLRYDIEPFIGGLTRVFFQDTQFGASWKYKESPEVRVSLEFPPGNPISRSDSLIHQFEQIALASKAVKQTIVNVMEGNAQLTVKFHDASFITAEPFAVRQDLIQRAVLLGGIGVGVSGLLPEGYYTHFSQNMQGLRLDVFGPNLEDLEALSNRFAVQLKRNVRVAEVDIDVGSFDQSDKRQFIQYRWRPDAQIQSQTTAQALSAALSPIFNARYPIAFADLNGEDRLPIRLVMGKLPETDIARLSEIPLPISSQKAISLGKTVAYTFETAPSDIIRENQQYKRTIAVDFRGPYDLAYTFLEEEISAMPIPAGYRIEMSKNNFFTEEVTKSFGWAIFATIFLVYLVMVFVFESWITPFLVLVSVPAAFMGVAVAFILTGANFAEGAFIGAVLLMGVAVNNGILLMATYTTLYRNHPARQRKKIMLLAIRKRLRPMWATTLVAVVGMMPVLVAPETNDFWLGLSATMTGGLLSSTILIPIGMMTFMHDEKNNAMPPHKRQRRFMTRNPLRRKK